MNFTCYSYIIIICHFKTAAMSYPPIPTTNVQLALCKYTGSIS